MDVVTINDPVGFSIGGVMDIQFTHKEKTKFRERVLHSNFRQKNQKRYIHFDTFVSYKYIKDKIFNSKWVSQYSFYPFLQFNKTYNKYGYKKEKKIDKNGKGIKHKTRTLSYCAHRDRWIYSLYAEAINIKYNSYAEKYGIDDAATAYRIRFGDKRRENNNIYFARKAFQFISKQKQCTVIAGDFTQFFDNLNHRYLKRQLKRVLNEGINGCNNNIGLPDDVYQVYKSIIHYAYCQMKDVFEFKYTKLYGVHSLGKKVERERIREVKKCLFREGTSLLSLDEFKELKNFVTPSENQKALRSYREEYGIPQGSPISAVFSNVYMIDFDVKMKEFVDEYSGLYMRYSDDFLVVVPGDINEYTLWDHIRNIIKSINEEELGDKMINKEKARGYLQISKDKVEVLAYSEGEFRDVTNSVLGTSHRVYNKLDYLGFSFDGKKTDIREKSISKYRYRMIRKAHKVGRNKDRYGRYNKADLESLYDLYGCVSLKAQSVSQNSTIKEVNKKKKGYNDSRKKTQYSGKKKNKKRYGNFFSYEAKARKIMHEDTMGINSDKQFVMREIRKYINEGIMREKKRESR